MNETILFNINAKELIHRILMLDSKDEITQDLKLKLIEQLVFPNVEDKKLYKYYDKIEILNNKIKEGRRTKTKIEEIKKAEIEKELNIRNSTIDSIKKRVTQNVENTKKSIILDNNTSIVTNRDYKDIDFIITLNHQYLIILCENDKLDIVDYKNKISQILKSNNSIELRDILEINNKYINTKFEAENVIYVTINNENKEIETKYKDIQINRFCNNTLINVLSVLIKEHKNEKSNLLVVLESILNQLQVKERIQNITIYEEIVKEQKIRVGERFYKSYTCFNCFYDKIKMSRLYGDFEKTLYDEIYYTQKAISKLKDSNNIEVWVADTTNNTNWGNIVKDNYLIEICNKNFDEIKEFKKIYRYTFIKKKDEIFGDYIEFIGIYGLDIENSKNEKRVWKRLDLGDNVSLNLEEIEKFIEGSDPTKEDNKTQIKKEDIKTTETKTINKKEETKKSTKTTPSKKKEIKSENK